MEKTKKKNSRFIKNLLKIILLLFVILLASYFIFTWCQVRVNEEDMEEVQAEELYLCPFDNSIQCTDYIYGLCDSCYAIVIK